MATVSVFDAESGQLQRETEAPGKGRDEDTVSFLLPVGDFVWCGCTDGTLTVFNSASVAIHHVQAHSEPVLCGAVSSRFVWTGSADCSIRAWDRDTGELRAVLRGHTNRVRCLASVGTTLWSGSDDNTIRVWHESAIPDGGRQDMAEEDEDVDEDGVFCPQPGESRVLKNELVGHRGGVMALLQVAGTVWSCSTDRTIRVWDAQGCRTLRELKAHAGWTTCLAFKDGLVWSGSLDRTIRTWDPATCKCVQVLRRHAAAVWSLLACHDGIPIVWSGAGDASFCLWETAEATLLPLNPDSAAESSLQRSQRESRQRSEALRLEEESRGPRTYSDLATRSTESNREPWTAVSERDSGTSLPNGLGSAAGVDRTQGSPPHVYARTGSRAMPRSGLGEALQIDSFDMSDDVGDVTDGEVSGLDEDADEIPEEGSDEDMQGTADDVVLETPRGGPACSTSPSIMATTATTFNGVGPCPGASPNRQLGNLVTEDLRRPPSASSQTSTHSRRDGASEFHAAMSEVLQRIRGEVTQSRARLESHR